MTRHIVIEQLSGLVLGILHLRTVDPEVLPFQCGYLSSNAGTYGIDVDLIHTPVRGIMVVRSYSGYPTLSSMHRLYSSF
jgi:hypothetical protein